MMENITHQLFDGKVILRVRDKVCTKPEHLLASRLFQDVLRRFIADLERKGVSDYLLINRNGLKNAISLGVFSSQDAVNRRLTEMTRKATSPSWCRVSKLPTCTG